MTDEREPHCNHDAAAVVDGECECGAGVETHSFIVWVEVEEVDDEGDHVTDHSLMLDGSSVATFDTLDEAVAFGDRLQKVAGLL